MKSGYFLLKEDFVNDVNDTISFKKKQDKVIPISTQNGKDFDLNHFKQFCKVLDSCKREVVKVHDKEARAKDKGSKDRGSVYVSFNGAMLLVLKTNMMKIAKSKYGVTLCADPKIELFGTAEERMCLDLKVKLKEQDHFLKMKVYIFAHYL